MTRDVSESSFLLKPMLIKKKGTLRRVSRRASSVDC